MNWLKYRLLYFLMSAVVIGSGLLGLWKWGLKFGVDFRGGTVADYRFEKEVSEEEMAKSIREADIELRSMQKSDDVYIFRLSTLTPEQKITLKQTLEKVARGKAEEMKFETVGASFGPELIKKTLYAMLIAASTILFWVAYQFKSFKFGISAVLAMIHDSLVLLGSFSLLGHFMGAEIDFLFVTAMLTVLSFSVHDTIVVYDRIRENQRKIAGSLQDLANKAVTETMVRSLNNSFTIIFMLVALILLGGSTIRWFAVALLIGTISGTYSSPFVAVPVLVTWDQAGRWLKIRFHK